MSLHEIYPWTLSGLVGAFLDLALVYVLLCISATVFIPCKILKVVGLFLPCPCSGFYGRHNTNLCFRRLLFNWPRRKICSVLHFVKTRFPFDLLLVDDQIGNSNRKLPTKGIPQLQNLADKDSDCDRKGKRIMYQRPRTKIRRGRRAAVECGRLARGICESNEARKERESVALVERDDFIQDVINESNHIHLSERTWRGSESSGSVGENNYMDKGSSTIGQDTSNAEERGTIRNEASSIGLLEEALEEEKAARASLFLELEEEREASATAADEAIAMIIRLQNEKASVEMEARQYQRVIEEKFAYDEEEMNLLREILVKREIDYHVLEKEIEAYREMDFPEEEQLIRNWDFILDDRKEQSSTTHYSNGDPPIVQEIENAISLSRKAKVNETKSYNSQCHFNEGGLLKQTTWTNEDIELKDNCLVCEHITTKGSHAIRSSVLDMEIDVQDIHVIDEKLHIGDKKEERKVDN